MKYYYIFYCYSKEPEDVLIAEKYNFKGIEDYDFQKGKEINWHKDNAMYYKEGTTAEDYLAQVHPSAVVISQKIKDILEKELKVKGLQFFPVPLKHTQSDKVIQGYYAMNVLNLIKDAVDKEKSLIHTIEADGLKVETVVKYTLREEKLKGQDVFRLDDGSGLFVSLFVSDRVKQAFDKTGITGIAFGETRLS